MRGAPVTLQILPRSTEHFRAQLGTKLSLTRSMYIHSLYWLTEKASGRCRIGLEPNVDNPVVLETLLTNRIHSPPTSRGEVFSRYQYRRLSYLAGYLPCCIVVCRFLPSLSLERWMHNEPSQQKHLDIWKGTETNGRLTPSFSASWARIWTSSRSSRTLRSKGGNCRSGCTGSKMLSHPRR